MIFDILASDVSYPIWRVLIVVSGCVLHLVFPNDCRFIFLFQHVLHLFGPCFVGFDSVQVVTHH